MYLACQASEEVLHSLLHVSLVAVCVCPQVVAILLKSGQYSQSYLQRSDMPHTALLLAAKSGNNNVIALLVTHGFNVNRKLQGHNGNALHEAVLYGKLETVHYLIQVGGALLEGCSRLAL